MSINLKQLSQDYQSLLKSSEFYDILIQVGKKSKKSNKVSFNAKAHSLILRTRSLYFREVLSKYGDKVPEKVIFDNPNITPKLFEILLRYIYDGTIDLTELEFKEIIYLLWGAQVLCLKELCDYIENIIVVEQTDLIKKHISLINREGLSDFTKLAALVRTVTDTAITNPTSVINLPTPQLNIQSTLIEQKHIVLIVKWINDISNSNPPNFYTFNLLQRASKHETGEILGGYNPIDWCKESKKNVYHSTSTSFIFSLNLQNLDNSIVSKVIDKEHAIKQHTYAGPTFGRNDLKICSELKENEKSRCRNGSYEKPIRNSKEFFCVDDYEVFQVF
ncbi:BTB-domain-containing protein [Gigaspora margarita]|uniref:BTB-domain-containing protein n=1 Tax=Gigaspora margarita TaxID=4874 RepID=A0A8H4EQP9_GIGMA|nr:BTB-domain-containing protein [Gigaspora margarita]